jgi:hypothetical protein
LDYADAVIAGTVDAGHPVHLACERFNRDRKDGTWEFRPELAELAMDFAGSLPNINGIEAGKVRSMRAIRLTLASKPLASRRSSSLGGGGSAGMRTSWASTCTSAFAVRRRSL